MAFWNLIASASKVIKSDLVEEANLELKLIKADIPKINLTQMEVNLEHHVLSQVTTAGEALGLSIVRDTAMTGLALLNFISQAKFKETLKPITVRCIFLAGMAGPLPCQSVEDPFCRRDLTWVF